MGRTSTALKTMSENGTQSNITIRAYRHPDDAGPIRKMFLDATTKGPGSPFSEEMAYRSLYKTVTYTVLGAGLALLALSRAYMMREVVNPTGIAPSSLTGIAGLLLLLSMFAFSYVRTQRRKFELLFEVYMKDTLVGLEDTIGTFKLRVTDNDNGLCFPTSRSDCWVAVDSDTGKVVGFVGLDCHYHPDPELGEVRRLMVSPDCQRRGVGDKLMDVLEDHARAHGVKALELTTSNFNKAAIRFYKKRRWTVMKRRQYAGTSLLALRRELANSITQQD